MLLLKRWREKHCKIERSLSLYRKEFARKGWTHSQSKISIFADLIFRRNISLYCIYKTQVKSSPTIFPTTKKGNRSWPLPQVLNLKTYWCSLIQNKQHRHNQPHKKLDILIRNFEHLFQPNINSIPEPSIMTEAQLPINLFHLTIIKLIFVPGPTKFPITP